MKNTILQLAECQSVTLCGGKAVNLGAMIRAGLPVPEGFVLTTYAYDAAVQNGGRYPDEVIHQAIWEWQQLGSPPVAVRSSATAEDGAATSLAGQFHTILGVADTAALKNALQLCLDGICSKRAEAYIIRHGIEKAALKMAVVVQCLVDADIAGVLFTVNPRTGDEQEMLIEASYGLGESVVSGEVQPDCVTISANNGTPTSVTIGTKTTTRRGNSQSIIQTDQKDQKRLCLDSQQVAELWRLGRHIARLLDAPQDIEWAISKGKIYLLQSRPITTLGATPALAEKHARLSIKEKLRRGQGPWVVHNLAETLQNPTPLTWDVIQKFMSGAGAFGALHRMVGYEPSPIANEQGILDLFAGTIYLDLSRAHEIYCAGFAYRHDFDALRKNPALSQSSPTRPCGTAEEKKRTNKVLAVVSKRISELATDFPEKWEKEVLPRWQNWVMAFNCSVENSSQWAEKWDEVHSHVFGQFAAYSLMPGLLLSWHLSRVKEICAETIFDEDADKMALLLASGGDADLTLQAAEDLYKITTQEMSPTDWIERYGHRAPAEFELAAPRWSEVPQKIQEYAALNAKNISIMQRHSLRSQESEACLQKILALLPKSRRQKFLNDVRQLRFHTKLRENAKFELMRGYALLRRLAQLAGEFLKIGDDVFFLTVDEIKSSLALGLAPVEKITHRKKEHSACREASLPTFIDANFFLPRPKHETQDTLEGFAISSGKITGRVKILTDPLADNSMDNGFIIVCSCTDPSWTPVFARANGLVIERGGALSHGAVVAREMGLPAVVLQNATTLLKDGETITVDGSAGAVFLHRRDVPAKKESSAKNLQKSDLPPPPDCIERLGRKIMLHGYTLSAIFLVLVYALPEGLLLAPIYHLFDVLLLPLWRSYGILSVPLAISLFFALAITVAQRFMTNNARLNLAKSRAAELQKKLSENKICEGEASTAQKEVSRVTSRVISASLTPLAVFVAPMVLSFTWLAARVDPASWPPSADADLHVSAMVAGDYTGDITASSDGHLSLKSYSQSTLRLPPIRQTLLEFQRELQSTAADLQKKNLSWPELAAASFSRDAMLADLASFLASPLPESPLVWSFTADGSPRSHTITLSPQGFKPISIRVPLGQGQRPEKLIPEATGRVQLSQNSDPAHPIRSVRISFAGPRTRGANVFWAPFSSLGCNWDIGWLGAYLLFYLPPFFSLRILLKLP